MSDTPRTDRAEAFDEDGRVVSASFARTLERENAELRGKLDAMSINHANARRYEWLRVNLARVHIFTQSGKMGYIRTCREIAPCDPESTDRAIDEAMARENGGAVAGKEV